MPYRLLTGSVVMAVLLTGWTGRVSAQVTEVATRPRFLAISSKHAAPVDASDAPVLQRRVSVAMMNVSAKAALEEVGRQAKIELLYSDDLVRLDRKVSLDAKNLTVAAALTEILIGTGVDVLVLANGQLGLMQKGGDGIRLRQGVVAGRVTDGRTGEGIAGAEVLLERSHWRTTTDTGGRYRLVDVDTGQYTLTVRRFGYQKQSRSVVVRDNVTDTVDLALESQAARLNELVSTATGMRRRMDIANDVTTINADSVVRTQPITSVTDLLENRVPGLTVQRTSGAPGDPARLRLRGAGSPFRSNDPIVIVDGIRVYAEQSAGRGANLASITSRGDTNNNSNTGNYAAPSPLDYIDPNTIETVEVIKGPSATTLYGPDAANGVIVITTKKGKAGPTRWTFLADHGGSRVPGAFPDLTVRWGHSPFYPDAVVACGRSTVVSCIPDSVVTFQMLNDPALTVLDHGGRNAINLGASGGTPALTYAVTGSYQRTLGLFKLPSNEVDRYESLRGGATPPDWMQRPQQLTQWGVTSSISAHVSKTADISLSSQFTRTEQQRSSLERQFGALLTTYFDQSSGAYYQGGVTDKKTGDILTNYYEQATASAIQFTNAVNLTWRPRPWLTMTSNAGLNVEHRNDEVFLPRGTVLGAGQVMYGEAFDSAGLLDNGHGSTVVGTVDLRGSAVVPLGLGLRLNLSAGTNYTGRSISDLTLATRYLPVGTSLIGDTISGKNRSVQSTATFGWYVEQSINHRKFSLSTGLRLDGGSNVGGKLSTTGGLPKIGFSYLLSDEPFFPLKDLFQSFRVRVSYGRASRQPGITDQLRLYTVPSPQLVDGHSVDVVKLKYLGNTEVRPERTSEFEGGFDTDLLEGRLGLTFTYYRKTTDDALLSVPLPLSIYGYGQTAVKNIGVIRNSGLEATLNTQWLRSGPITLGTNLQLTRNRNVVVKLGPGVTPFYITAGGVADARVAPGYPLFSRWTKPILGYADANGNGVLETSEVILGDTAVYLGSSTPTYLVDLNTNLSVFRGTVTVSAGLHYDDGFTQVDELSSKLAPFAAAKNSSTSTIAEQAAVIDLTSTRYNWFQPVHVVRLQSIAVAYRMPMALARRVGAQQVSVALQGTNLGLWTNYRGLDPDVNGFSTGSATSDSGILPQPRTWQVRINATY